MTQKRVNLTNSVSHCNDAGWVEEGDDEESNGTITETAKKN